MTKIEIYILTHKPFDEEYDKELYKPLLNGSASHEDDFGFLRDDTGDNISHLNNKFSELTGEYWAWKNSDADIYGFCHYRRWFVKNLKLDKLTKEDIKYRTWVNLSIGEKIDIYNQVMINWEAFKLYLLTNRKLIPKKIIS